MLTREQISIVFKDVSLTERQQCIVRLALNGFSNKQIETSAGLTRNIVEREMRNVFTAVNVCDMRELFSWITDQLLATSIKEHQNEE